uniref:Uncharacterized protein n=1 Tax=Panagrolaimus sp. ES5 TaxID=591445 RepID=A0AC34F3R3_9BILA
MLASNCLKNDTEKIAQCESKVHQPSLSKPTETEQLAPIQAKEEVEIKQALPDMSYLQYSDINAEQIMKEIQGKKLKTMLQTIQLPTLNELTNAPQKDGLTPQQQRFHDYTLEAQQKYSGIIKQNLNKAESKDVNVDSMKAIEDGKFVELEDECEKQSLESATSACPTESTLIRITNSLQNVKFGDHQQPKESDSKLSEELIKAQKQLEYFQKLAADQAEALKNFELAKSLEKQLSAATEKTDKAEKALRKREALDSVSRDLVLKRFKEEDDDEHSPVV